MNFEYIKSSIKISAMAFFVLCGSLSFQNCGGNFDTLKSSSALQSVAPIFSSGSPLHLNEIANQNSGDSSISAPALGSTISISTSSRLAGAIGSLTWNGKEFINQDDHGRELQSASAFDGLGECFNPTEAGSLADNATSTSILIGLEAVGNNLQTTSQMAFWTPVNYSYRVAVAETQISPSLKIGRISQMIY